MGYKRERKRERLFLYSACLLIIALLITGCSTTRPFEKGAKGNKHLDTADKLIIKGDYVGALKEYEAASPKDYALFYRGLLWARPDNPMKDYKKALECFEGIARDFPKSALLDEAGVWTAAVTDILSLNNRIGEDEAALTALKEEVAGLKEKDKDLEETTSALKRKSSALKETEEKNRELEATVKALKIQLNALKEIDLGIEGKQR
jgi:hypothetical protein